MAPERNKTSGRNTGSATQGKKKGGNGGNPAKVVLTESLHATEEERCATSRSLYGDSTARIASNVSTIHDRLRLRAYEAVFRSVRGKTVLHLGCGMGLYSMLAARHLAKHVVAVDTSSIVQAAREVAKQNNLHNITFFRGRLSDVLPQFSIRSFDVVLCEWMDALILNHHLLSDVLYARDHLLSPTGVICPNRSSLHVVGVSDYGFRLDTIDFWSNVYGFAMDPMKRLVEREVEVCAIPAANIATNTCLAYTVKFDELPGLTPEECAVYERPAIEPSAEEEEDNSNQRNEEGKKKEGAEEKNAATLKCEGDEKITTAAAEAATTTMTTKASPDVAAAMDNPITQRWPPCKVAQEGFEVPFTLYATAACTLHYLTFFVDASFTSPVDIGANFVLAIKPGGHNAWTEVSVGLKQALPLAAGESVTGTVKAFTPLEGNGKMTIVRVTAKTEGRVAAIETSGEYVYQSY